jgi:hypothetical protein
MRRDAPYAEKPYMLQVELQNQRSTRTERSNADQGNQRQVGQSGGEGEDTASIVEEANEEKSECTPTIIRSHQIPS